MIRCAHCGTSNGDGSRFCSQCGEPLEAVNSCPSCGWSNLPSARFCNQCGARLGVGDEGPSPRDRDDDGHADVQLPSTTAADTAVAVEPEPSEEVQEPEQPEETEVLERHDDLPPAWQELTAEGVAELVAEEEATEAWSQADLQASGLPPVAIAGPIGSGTSRDGDEAPHLVAPSVPASATDLATTDLVDVRSAVEEEGAASQPPDGAELILAKSLTMVKRRPSVASDSAWSVAAGEAFAAVVMRTPEVGTEPKGTAGAEGDGAKGEKACSEPFASLKGEVREGATRRMARGGGRRVDQIIGLVLLVAVVLPLLGVGPGVAAQPTPAVRSGFDVVEALPPRTAVLVAFDWDAGTLGEMRFLSDVIVRHLMSRGARLVAVSLVPQGPAFADRVLAAAAETAGYRYGEDYVNLGYVPGNESGLVALAENLTGFLPRDYTLGRPSGEMTVTRGLQQVNQFGLVVVLAGDDASASRWIQQIRGRYGVPMIAVTSATVGPSVMPYVQGERPALRGLVAGVAGAAEYAVLTGGSSVALSATAQSQGAANLVLVGTVLAGNVALLLRRLRTSAEGPRR